MEGLVWEDLRTETVENTIQGNGKKDNGEPAIPNARVTLYDVNKQGAAQIYDGSKWFPAITKTDENGKYSFKGYIPGEYCVIFSYGFDEQGENGYIKYNGQDYKSTIYHSDYNENNPDDDNYWIALGQLESEKNTNYSYARDIMGNESTQGTRNYVNKYSGKDEVTNALSQKLYNTTQDTYMIAKSAKINAEIEYDRTVSDTSASGSNNRGSSNYNQSGYYNIEGINLGLQERPKAQLKVISKAIRKGMKDVRNSLNKMRPDFLQQYRLKEAIEKMKEEISNVTDLKINLNYQIDETGFDTKIEDILFRVIQESITNSIRHGLATVVDINIYKENNLLCLKIKDNGKGCKAINYGFGLKQMVERVSQIRGDINFYSENGFTTEIKIPL